MSEMFYLEGQHCNLEYGETFHRSLHVSEQAAKDHVDDLVTTEQLAGQDAPNEWDAPEWKTRNHPQFVSEFRTGDWGYTVFSLYRIEVVSG